MSSQPGLRSRASRRAFSFSHIFVALLVTCVLGLVSVPSAHAVKMQITYTDGANEGFYNPTRGAQRRAAFEAVLNNWGNRITGSVPIQVSASFDPITDEKGNKGGILAQAYAYSNFRDWSNFFNQLPPPKRAATYYPVALANQQAGKDLDPDHPDIVVQCNTNIDSDPATGFYYGLDADVPDGQTDFYTVLYHEVGHGLGFASTFNQDGSYSIENGYADIYSVFLRSRINNATQYLTQVTQAQRAAAFINGHVWFAGTNAEVGGAEDSCLLYAPSTYQPGSSISHLDEDTFHGIDELMTPVSSEPVHAPGPRVTGVFRDMGYTISNTDLTPPNVTISAPTSGAVISQSLSQIRGTVSDSGSGLGRVRVIFSRKSDNKFWTGSSWETNSTLLKATISGTTWTLSTVPTGSDLSYGTYNLVVTAWDTANNSKVAIGSFEVADVSEPNVYIAYPVEGIGYKILTTSVGTASTNTDYVKVALRNSDGNYWNWNTSAFGTTTFVDSDNAKRIQVPPYNWQASLPTIPDGDYTLFAAGVNTANVGSQYVARNFYVDTTGPDLKLTDPSPTSSVTSLTALSGTCTDRSGIKDNKVTFTLYQNGQYWTGSAWTDTQTTLNATVQSDGTWTYTTLPTENIRSGIYYFSGSATDTLGNVSAATPGANQTSFRLDASPPNCTITSPTNGSSVNGITSITGTAFDDGGLDRISLYIVRYSDGAYWDGTAWGGGGSAILPVNYDSSTRVWTSAGALPGNNASDPAHNWTNGSYDIIAIAYDQAGNQTRADSVVTYQYAYTWTGATLRDNDSTNDSNNWDTAANWLPYGIPGADDNAIIKNGDTVKADGSHSVKGLTVTGSTLNTTGLLVKNLDLNGNIYGGQVNSNGGTWNWSGGTIGGTWSVFAGAQLNVNGTAGKLLDNAAVLNNSGTITFTSSSTIQGYQNTAINNLSGANFVVDGSSSVFSDYYGGNVFNNAAGATFKKQDSTNIPTNVSTINAWTFNNSGAIVSNTGILNFNNGTTNFADGCTISGSGRTQLSGTTFKFTGTTTLQSTTFDMTAGYLGGTGTLASTGASTFNWTGGTIFKLDIGTGTSFVISGDATKLIDNGGVINNSGHATLKDAGALQGYQNATFNNLKGATFTVASDADIVDYYGGNAFNNQAGATFEKTVGGSTDTTQINWAFNNSGLAKVSQGVLALNGSSTDAGTFTTTSPAISRFTGGTHALKIGTLFNGTGKMQVAGATLTSVGNAIAGSATTGTTVEVTSGTLTSTGTNTFTSYGTFNWTGGTIGGICNVGAGTAFNINGTATKLIDDKGIINNSGRATFKDAGALQGYQNATFNNLKGATFTVASDADIVDYYGGNAFNNQAGATFEKTVGGSTDTTQINWAFNNSGLVKESQGVLALNGSSTDAGTFSPTTPGIVRFIGGTHSLKTGTLFTGTGKTQVAGGNVSVTGNVVAGSASAGTTLEVSSGSITGSNTTSLTCYGTVNWTGGSIGGVCNIAPKAALNLLGEGTKLIDNAGVINNFGITKWTGPGSLQGYQNATFNNVLGGVFNVAADGNVLTDYYGGNTFNNQSGATFAKMAGAGTSTLASWTFNGNGGSFDVTTGTLQSKIAFNMTTNTSVSGAGTLQLSGASSLSGVLTSASHVIMDGTLSCTKNTPACHYAGAGLFDWTRGTIGGTLTFDAGTKSNLSGTDNKLIDNASVINNAGTMTWLGGGALQGYQNATFNNLKDGVFNIADDGSVLVDYYGGNTFNNQSGATFAKTGGVKVSNVGAWTFNNSGSLLSNVGLDKATGCALEFNAVLNMNGGTVGGARFTRFKGSALTIAGIPTIANTTFEIFAGTVAGTGSVATSGTGVLKWTNGTIKQLTTSKGAILSIAGADQRMVEGTLTNNGTATWSGGNIQGYQNSSVVNNAGATFIDVSKASFVDYYGGNLFKNAGTFKTGASVGKTAMSWGFTQLSTGTLAVDVTSTAATGFDLYSVGGAATLAGTLQIVRPSTYLPPVGSTFKFLTGGTRTGQFATVQNATIDSARQFQVLYNAQDVTLQVKGVSLSINDVKVTEGTGAGKGGIATFTVTLSGAQTVPVTVKYATASGTALTGTDFTAATGTLTFSPGEKSKTVKVLIVGDSLGEADETFALNLSSPTNAAIGDGSGLGTIVDDDAAPALSVNDVSLAEGNSGTKAMVFTIKLSTPSGQSVIVNYATINGTATAGSDYTNLAGSFTFAPGETTKTVSIAIKGDTAREANETFTLALSRPTNALIADGVGIGTITNDDGAASPSVTSDFDPTPEGSAGSS